jgi:hypothetical protein
MGWTGNTNNEAPNTVQEGTNVSEVRKDVNRAHEVRRDQDTQKNFTVLLTDVDEAILTHLNRLNLSVIDSGRVTNVPVYMASPERWKSVQVDGYFRDYNGKMILPAIVIHRESSDKDESMKSFNRYLRYPTLQKYSKKNQYTPFTALMGANVPVNDVFDLVMPDHMIFLYKFIIWTEKMTQMNKLVEEINFATEDYWGDPKRFKFRTYVNSFVHTVEVEAESSRVVKTEFDLTVHGYLLPPQFDGKRSTTRRSLTPKKIVLGLEVVASDYDMESIGEDLREKWRNQNYPNLPKDEEIPAPSVAIWNDVRDGSSYNVAGDILDTFNRTSLPDNVVDTGGTSTTSGVAWRTAPSSPNDYGEDGWLAYDNRYLYVYSNSTWRRVPINQFS